MKSVAGRPELDGNMFMSEDDQKIRERILAADVFEFLVEDYWRAKTALAENKRRLRKAGLNTKKRRRKKGLWVAKRARKLLRRIARVPRSVIGRLRSGTPKAPSALGNRLATAPGEALEATTPESVHYSRVAPPGYLYGRLTALDPWLGKRLGQRLGKRLQRPLRRPLGALLPSILLQGEAAPSSEPQPHRSTGPKVAAAEGGYPRVSDANSYDALDFMRAREIGELHRQLEERVRHELRTTGRKLRIGFVVNEREKWNGDALTAEIERTGWAEWGFVLTLRHHAVRLDHETRRQDYLADRDFFFRTGPVWHELYEVGSDIERPIEEIDCDILFLQQPWGMKEFPRRLVGRTLCAYMHYGFMVMGNHGMHYNIASFHSYLWKYFTQTELHRQMHLANDPSAYDKLVVSGYPKLDVYLNPPPDRQAVTAWRNAADTARPRVIFAPHHSLGKDNLKMSTFRWSGPALAELAEAHSGIDWVYKPHPNLASAVLRNKVMSRAEYAAYVRGWHERLNASVFDEARYFDIFRTSDVLITDCGSFLAEYLPTGKPIIWLVSDTTVGLNAVGARLAEGFYAVRTESELRGVFEAVVVRGEDRLAAVRRQKIAQVMPSDRPASEGVTQFLMQTFRCQPHRISRLVSATEG